MYFDRLPVSVLHMNWLYEPTIDDRIYVIKNEKTKKAKHG
jgi:hypothetical protein